MTSAGRAIAFCSAINCAAVRWSGADGHALGAVRCAKARAGESPADEAVPAESALLRSLEINTGPAFGIRHPASGIRHPAFGIRHPASGIRPPAPASRIPPNTTSKGNPTRTCQPTLLRSVSDVLTSSDRGLSLVPRPSSLVLRPSSLVPVPHPSSSSLVPVPLKLPRFRGHPDNLQGSHDAWAEETTDLFS